MPIREVRQNAISREIYQIRMANGDVWLLGEARPGSNEPVLTPFRLGVGLPRVPVQRPNVDDEQVVEDVEP